MLGTLFLSNQLELTLVFSFQKIFDFETAFSFLLLFFSSLIHACIGDKVLQVFQYASKRKHLGKAQIKLNMSFRCDWQISHLATLDLWDDNIETVLHLLLHGLQSLLLWMEFACGHHCQEISWLIGRLSGLIRTYSKTPIPFRTNLW